MNIKRIIHIAVPVMIVTMLVITTALDATYARALARYDGPGHWTNPPGWSNHNGVARFDGPGHWINPPGWSNA